MLKERLGSHPHHYPLATIDASTPNGLCATGSVALILFDHVHLRPHEDYSELPALGQSQSAQVLAVADGQEVEAEVEAEEAGTVVVEEEGLYDIPRSTAASRPPPAEKGPASWSSSSPAAGSSSRLVFSDLSLDIESRAATRTFTLSSTHSFIHLLSHSFVDFLL